MSRLWLLAVLVVAGCDLRQDLVCVRSDGTEEYRGTPGAWREDLDGEWHSEADGLLLHYHPASGTACHTEPQEQTK